MKNIKKILMLAASMAALNSQAATVEISNAASVGLGQLLQVRVVASDLAANQTPSIAAFDFDVLFDSNILRFDSVSFGTQLNFNGSLQDFALNDTAGSLNVNEVSYASAQDLNNLQAGQFDLFSLWFTAVGQGSSQLKLQLNAAADAQGNDLSLSLANSDVQVVPLPAGLPLLLSGMGLMLAVRRKRDK
jgi:hypothetical protein